MADTTNRGISLMKKLFAAMLSVGMTLTAVSAIASPAGDLDALKTYFQKRFPDKDLNDFVNGPYALNADKRINWEGIEEFPPYEDLVEAGGETWAKPFANGKSFATCFGDDPSAVRVKYPRWDSKSKAVVTLEGAINKCLKDNGEKPFNWKKGKLAHESAYLGFEARGQKVDVKIPEEAMDAYNSGKQFFYAKRGQLNLACADCHVYNAGNFARGNVLSPLYGQVTHFPVWRGKWDKKNDGFGTLHRRYGGCMKQVRAKPLKAQGKTFRNLELFHQAMSNGLEINAPGYRE
jgi:sulfur-oxidizing protein SoxA